MLLRQAVDGRAAHAEQSSRFDGCHQLRRGDAVDDTTVRRAPPALELGRNARDGRRGEQRRRLPTPPCQRAPGDDRAANNARPRRRSGRRRAGSRAGAPHSVRGRAAAHVGPPARGPSMATGGRLNGSVRHRASTPINRNRTRRSVQDFCSDRENRSAVLADRLARQSTKQREIESSALTAVRQSSRWRHEPA